MRSTEGNCFAGRTELRGSNLANLNRLDVDAFSTLRYSCYWIGGATGVSSVLVLLLFLIVGVPVLMGQESVCAQVKIEILQQLTMEREAFEGRMTINNGLTGVNLDQITVDVTFADKSGAVVRATSDANDLTAKFYIRLQDGSSIPAIIAGGTSARILWLIIPAKGAAGQSPQGELYSVGATLHYRSGGQSQDVQVSPATITVKPLPDLTLDYFLPSEVYGDDPFTDVIESPVPFSLGVRVQNTGYGIARNLRIESAQPKIVDNKLGLLVDFRIQGSEVNGLPATASLLANFGDIQPNRSGVARWVMTSTLSGRFVEFTANYTHADELGGELTSLFSTNGIHTHFLVHDVLVDLPGRDGIKDFLAKDGEALRVYESENTDTLANDLSASSSISGSQGRYTVSTAPSSGFIFIKQSDPLGGTQQLRSATRGDGKALNAANAWLSKTQDRNTHQWSYFANVFDVNNTAGLPYTLQFEAAAGQTNRPPALDPINHLVVYVGYFLSFPITAFDPDANRLTFSLVSGPTNATLNPATGLFQWRPNPSQAGTNVITVRVTDDGTPNLSDTAQFAVEVGPAIGFELSLGSTNVFPGESNAVPVVLKSDLSLTNVIFLLTAPESHLTNLSLQSLAPEVLSPPVLEPLGSNRYALSFEVDPLRIQYATRTLAQLGFQSLLVQTSAIVGVPVMNLMGKNLTGLTFSNSVARGGQIIIFAREPVLVANRNASATLYGRPGANYTVEISTNLSPSGFWVPVMRFPLTNRWETFGTENLWPASFYRAYESEAAPPLLPVQGNP